MRLFSLLVFMPWLLSRFAVHNFFMKQYRDHYFKKAKQDNYPARSVYKLQEIEKRFHIFRQGQHVVDLGAAPGSWTLWLLKK